MTPIKRNRKRLHKKIYALYKGEEILKMGTIKEISEELGINEKSVRFYKTLTYKKRNKGNNHRVLIEIEE